MPLFETNNDASRFAERSPLIAALRNYTNPSVLKSMDFVTRQLSILLEDYYVHLPLKRSSLGIDPLQELKVLLDEVNFIATEGEFYRRLLFLMRRLRDRHTAIRLPSPWRDAIAYLPFAAESYFTSTGRGVIVTKLMTDLQDRNFIVGAEITHWNGVPIGTFIEGLSWQNEGAHPYARIAIALRFLTTRPLAYWIPPEEDWVTITYLDLAGTIRSVVFPWRIYFPDQVSSAGRALMDPSADTALSLGIDRSTLIANNSWHDLFVKPAAADEKGIAVSPQWANYIEARILQSRTGNCGYIRIFSFSVDDPAGFVVEVANVLKQLPKKGVVIDVRSNPGGTILAGEGLLGLFKGNPVRRERLSFRNTAATRRVGALPQFSDWRRSLDMQISTGDLFSQSFSLEHAENLPTGVFDGKVVVIIDSLTYSTSDFFAAGMQDNELAVILGVDPVSGAGGANVWDHSIISQLEGRAGGTSVVAMPIDLDISVAVRRSLRVGVHEGLPLEGLGVFADQFYRLTKQDILGKNEGLLQFAAGILDAA